MILRQNYAVTSLWSSVKHCDNTIIKRSSALILRIQERWLREKLGSILVTEKRVVIQREILTCGRELFDALGCR